MATELIVCPRCGASPSGSADAQGMYVCAYCGSRFRTQATQLVAKPINVSPPLARPARPVAPPVKKSSPIVVLAAMGLLIAIGIAGGAAAWINAKPGDGSSSLLPTATGQNAGLLVTPQPNVPDVPATATFKAESHVSGYQSSFYVLGYVTNTSPFTIDKPKVTAVLLDKSGKEVASRDGYAECDALVAGATAAVNVLVSDPPAHDHIKFELVVSKANYIPSVADGLRLEVLEAPHITFGSSWELTGKVFNDGKQTARFVSIQVQAFDAKDTLIGLDSTYVDGEAIKPGASARFHAMPLYEAAPHHFKYFVAGRGEK